MTYTTKIDPDDNSSTYYDSRTGEVTPGGSDVAAGRVWRLGTDFAATIYGDPAGMARFPSLEAAINYVAGVS